MVLLNYQMSHYLNYNSTCLTGGSNHFNISDLGYSEVRDYREAEELIKTQIKEIVGADDDARVIFNSGSTESIATIINWAKSCNRFGSVVGSKFDHDAVEANCNNLDMNYEKIIDISGKIPLNTSLVLINQVDSKTGEIFPANDFIKNNEFKYLDRGEDELEKDLIRQYKPIFAMDVTQSIGKLSINMKERGLNAIFFSLHKLGGNMNAGVLVVRDEVDIPFKPLISGSQQHKMRGGTYNVYDYLDFDIIYEDYKEQYDRDENKQVWDKMYELCVDAGLNVYKPKYDHLYTTLLINTNNTCNLGIISELSDNGIYVGSSSACKNESEEKDTNVRISFLNKSQLNEKIMKKIIKVIQKHSETHSDIESSSE